MKAANNVTARLAKRIDWALTILGEIFVADASGSDPPNELFCCNIRSSRAFVRSAGFGWIAGMIWTMKAVVTPENRAA